MTNDECSHLRRGNVFLKSSLKAHLPGFRNVLIVLMLVLCGFEIFFFNISVMTKNVMW